ncbi:hypothetical protein WJX74_003549 [Apatococcus lobatus]|uniref:Uncharacterized protein n=1 Tax=Apatococcus lobatus TaxID=904363 RepID=A0AAW1RYH0_9CHLO
MPQRPLCKSTSTQRSAAALGSRLSPSLGVLHEITFALASLRAEAASSRKLLEVAFRSQADPAQETLGVPCYGQHNGC